jgi:hypothetical protein
MCTFVEALDQYRLSFHITSITSLEENIPSHSLQPFVSAKRLIRVQRRAMLRPPLTTRCVVKFAPSPQGPRHIRTITGGSQALDNFIAAEALSSTARDTPSKVEPHSPPIKRISSAQAPTRIKRGAHSPTPPLPPPERVETGTHPTRIPCSPTATLLHRHPSHCSGRG